MYEYYVTIDCMLILQNKYTHITILFICYITDMIVKIYLEFLSHIGLMLKYQFPQP